MGFWCQMGPFPDAGLVDRTRIRVLVSVIQSGPDGVIMEKTNNVNYRLKLHTIPRECWFRLPETYLALQLASGMICSWWDSERVKTCRGSCKKMGQDAAAAMRKAGLEGPGLKDIDLKDSKHELCKLLNSQTHKLPDSSVVRPF